ncbi:hypothetical protein LTR85_012013 [Meristemomyces frigidus]|nr:hypothetical protein LTR85_012013 [Meristemomyces frigidus]
MDSLAPSSPLFGSDMPDAQEPSTAVAYDQPATTNGAAGEERAPLALAQTPQPRAQEVQLPSTSDLDQQPTQLYSPTKAEIDSHPIRQRLSVVRDDITTSYGLAPEEPPTTEQSRQEPVAAPAQPAVIDAMADKEIKEGDDVSWQWSGSRPGGTVNEVVEEGQASVTSKRGNEIHKNASPDDPAVKISRSGNDVVKKAHELDVEEEGDKHKEAAGEEKTVGEDEEEKPAENGEKPTENGDAQTGEKRKAEEMAEEEKPAAATKKQKKTAEPKANGEKAEPKKKGRPAKKETNGDSTAKKETTKKREPKKAATESGQPRRSGRNKA